MTYLDFLYASGAVIGILVGIIGLFLQVQTNKNIEKRLQKEIADAESRVAKEPERTKPAWDLARITLEAYFNRNLSQINYIFWLSAFVMIAGFGILRVGNRAVIAWFIY